MSVAHAGSSNCQPVSSAVQIWNKICHCHITFHRCSCCMSHTVSPINWIQLCPATFGSAPIDNVPWKCKMNWNIAEFWICKLCWIQNKSGKCRVLCNDVAAEGLGVFICDEHNCNETITKSFFISLIQRFSHYRCSLSLTHCVALTTAISLKQTNGHKPKKTYCCHCSFRAQYFILLLLVYNFFILSHKWISTQLL